MAKWCNLVPRCQEGFYSFVTGGFGMGEAKRKRRRIDEIIRIAKEFSQLLQDRVPDPEERVAATYALVTEIIAADPTLPSSQREALLGGLLNDDDLPPTVFQETLGDAGIEERYRANMEELAKTLDRRFNGDRRGAAREIGFVLLMFPFGAEVKGRCNFISNGADRKDIISLFREMIARFQGATSPDQPGHA